jgi:hypothetical protein
MLLFNMYLLFLILALAAWLITIVLELRGNAPDQDTDQSAVTD